MKNCLTLTLLALLLCFKAQAYGPDLSVFYGNFVFQNYTTNTITVDNLYFQVWDISRGWVDCLDGAGFVQAHFDNGGCFGIITVDVLNATFWVGYGGWPNFGHPSESSYSLGLPALGAVVLAPGVCQTNCFYFNAPPSSDAFNVSIMGHLPMMAYYRTSGVNGEGIITDGGYSMDLFNSPQVTYSCVMRWGSPPIPVSAWCPIHARYRDADGTVHSRLWKLLRR